MNECAEEIEECETTIASLGEVYVFLFLDDSRLSALSAFLPASFFIRRVVQCNSLLRGMKEDAAIGPSLVSINRVIILPSLKFPLRASRGFALCAFSRYCEKTA